MCACGTAFGRRPLWVVTLRSRLRRPPGGCIRQWGRAIGECWRCYSGRGSDAPAEGRVNCRVDDLQVELPDATEHLGNGARLVFGYVGAEALTDSGQVHLGRGPERALALAGER